MLVLFIFACRMHEKDSADAFAFHMGIKNWGYKREIRK